LARKSKSLDLSIRSPVQERSRNTVEVIIEAATRILHKYGAARLNTNLIAERAGASIGTLYQYFPNKQAILVTIARRQLQKDRASVMEAISDALSAPGSDLERIVIRKVIELYKERTQVRRVVMQNLIALGLDEEITKTMEYVVIMLCERLAPSMPDHLQPISPARVFIIANAVESVIRAAAYGNKSLLDSCEFEGELVCLVRAYLHYGRNDRRV
jgi:AcrR family transcriptional regulator